MARSRVIKPEFWNDEKLARVSREARLTFVGMWTCSDDYGVTKGNLAWLKSQIYPYDENLKMSEFAKWIGELESIGRILGFTQEDEKYYYIKHFSDHQRVDHPSAIRNPSPPADILSTDSRESREDSRALRVETEVKQNINRIETYSRNGIPYDQIKDAFQRIIPDLPGFTLTEKRKEELRKRWKTDDKTSNIEWWTEQFFPLIAESEFLTGRSGKWTSCNIDWILKPANFQKIREGTYNR